MKKIIFLFSLTIISLSVSAQIVDSAKRKVNLQGAANFRDLGGYTTADGHHVKWNKIYRSADMSKLTDADLAILAQRNIAYDVDLRGTQESKQAPDKLNPNTDYILCPAGSDSLNNGLMKNLTQLKGRSADSIMIGYYSNTTYLKDRYKPFFDKLLGLPTDKSLVFHCTAGKDRTGIGAALLLYVLGVPYTTIVQDYEASNYYRKDVNGQMVGPMMKMMGIDSNTANAMLGVKHEYLDATFAALTKQYGSVDNFLKTQIGLDASKIKALRKQFLD